MMKKSTIAWVWTVSFVALSGIAVAADAPAPTTGPAVDAPADSQPAVSASVQKKRKLNAEAEKNRLERIKKIESVCKELTLEANDLDNFDAPNPEHKPQFTRPHPSMSTLGPEYALQALDRMGHPFTGNEFRDTYIRWHLMYLVKSANQEEKEQMGEKLIGLIKTSPGAIEPEERREWYWDPEEIGRKWWNLAHSGHRVVGYPPFQREVGPPESYNYMTGDEKAQVEANLKEAETLKDKFKTVVDPKAIAWNNRIRNVNYIIRQYRGELIYSLIFTGDPEMARAVVKEIDRQARLKSGITFDLVAFVYTACYDGALDLYDQSLLNELSKSIETSARSMEGYVKYSNINRNFADYVFHLIYLLQDGGAGFKAPKEGQSIQSRRHEFRDNRNSTH